MARLINTGQMPPSLPETYTQNSARLLSEFDWSHYLKSGEILIWQGKSIGGFRMTRSDYPAVAFGLFFSGFALFWMMTAYSATKGSGSLFPLFGMLHFLIGLYVAFGRHFVSARKRSRTFYSLTNSRALISENGTLHSISLHSGSNFEIQHHKDSESIFFDQANNSGNVGPFNFSYNRYAPKKLGFQWIVDGRDVYQKLLQIVERLK